MKKVTIELPDDCEIQIVKKQVEEVKRENKKLVIKSYKDMMKNESIITGFRINEDSEIVPIVGVACNTDKNIAITEKIAKSMLAMAMISQLIPYYGGEITDEEWKSSLIKYVIVRYKNEINLDSYINSNYYLLAFHTKEQRDEFFKHNEQLVKDYLMIK